MHIPKNSRHAEDPKIRWSTHAEGQARRRQSWPKASVLPRCSAKSPQRDGGAGRHPQRVARPKVTPRAPWPRLVRNDPRSDERASRSAPKADGVRRRQLRSIAHVERWRDFAHEIPERIAARAAASDACSGRRLPNPFTVSVQDISLGTSKAMIHLAAAQQGKGLGKRRQARRCPG